jgi:hypothetical protein
VSAKLSRGRKSDAPRFLILNEEHALFVVRLPTGADLDRQVLDVEREVSKLHDLLEGALELPAETHNGILLLRRPSVHRKPLLALLRFQAGQVIQEETWRKERFLRARASARKNLSWSLFSWSMVSSLTRFPKRSAATFSSGATHDASS